MEFEEHILPKEEKLPTLLPVKVKGKWVYKANDIDDGKSDSEKEETKNKVQSNKETSEKPNIVLMVQIADSIMSKPQENYKLLHTLREYCQHPDLSLKEQQLGILTLCRIYMDILPDYKMREYKESDLNASFKKDVKSLRNYEFGILTQYQLYLQNLHTIIDKGYQTNTNHKATLCYASVKSLQQLMFSKPNFNFRKNIIQVLCTKANSGSFNLSDSEHLCTETLIELIKRDRLGLISLEITQYIVQVINKRKFNLHENVLMVLSHLNLSERIIDAKLGKRKDTDMMSKKQKKRYKKQKELDKEMREAESSYNTEEQVQFQRQTLEALYQIVFKILKKADGDCRLIYPAILLIGKFGHLITIDVVPGVFKMLRVIALNNNYDMPSRIACGYAAKMLLFRGSDELSLDLNSFFIACNRLASASKDCSVKIWNISSGQVEFSLAGHTKFVTQVKWGHFGIYTSSRDTTVRMFDHSGKTLKVLKGHGHWVNTLSLSTEHLLKSGPFSHDSSAIENKEDMYAICKSKFSTIKEELLISGSDDNTLILWNPIAQTKPLKRMTGHHQPITSVQFSPDNRYIASACFDKSIKIWNSQGEFLYNLKGHVGKVYQLSFSPDSRLLISASQDSTCKIWSLVKQKLAMDLPGHLDQVYALEWSPTGDYAVSGGKDKLVKIWKS